jgi:MIP family channel proteins
MRDSWRHFASEFIGVFALVFVGGAAIITSALLRGTSDAGPTAVLSIALAHGIILGIMVTATMRISGHLNPAVTVGFLVTGRIQPMMAAVYWVAQFFGGVVGAYALKLLYPATIATLGRYGAQSISGDTTMIQAIVLEAIATFFLTFVVFGTAVDPKAPKVGGFAIGLAVTAGILAIGPLTGGSMNPARSFGPAIVSGVFEGQTAYWIGPIVGAILAAVLYDRLFLRRPPEPADHGAVRPESAT